MPCAYKTLIVCIVIEISLNQDDRRSLVSGAGSQVTQRADQIGQLSVVPWEAMLPFKSPFFALMLSDIACFKASPLKFA